MPSTKKSSRRSSKSSKKSSSRINKRSQSFKITDVLLIIIVLLVLYFVLAENNGGSNNSNKRLIDVGLDLDLNVGDTNIGVGSKVALNKDKLTGNLGVNIDDDVAYLEGDVDFGDKHKYGVGAYLGVNEDLYGMNLGFNSKRNKPYINIGEIEEGFTNLAEMKPKAGEITIVLFHAEWCGYCKKFMPTWEKSASALNNTKTGNGKLIKFVAVEADANPEVVKQYDVSGYPTIMILKYNGVQETYNGERTMNGLKEFVELNA